MRKAISEMLFVVCTGSLALLSAIRLISTDDPLWALALLASVYLVCFKQGS